jgi:6-phosphogluconolactonase
MTDPASHPLQSFADPEALARYAAQWLCNRALAGAGNFAICLSGGSTPRRLYEILAEPAMASQMPWSRCHWFFGDERFVPHDHPDSNFRMVREALFAHAPIPGENIHPVPTQGLAPQEAALAYEATLKRYYGAAAIEPRRNLFDVTLLGLGEDGHTASLFPGHPVLEETRHWAAAVIGAKSEARITLTYPALDSSAEVAFLATGASKREILGRVCAGDASLPAMRVRPTGRLHWFVDRAALPEAR